ncbi:MAG: FAD-dependent oxidoreductase [Acidobacteriota bacterium]
MAQTSTHEPAPKPEPAQKPILLSVDDDPQVLRAVVRDLRRRYGSNYRIVRADSGAAALEALDELLERSAPVALVLADQRMPSMTGVELLGAVRERVPDAKRVLLTAYADTDAAIQAINTADVDYYLLKPWDPPDEKLYPVLDDLLDTWRADWRPGFSGLRVIGHRWSHDAHRIKDFLARNLVPYRWLDVERDDDACTLLGGHDPSAPLVMLPDGERLAAPSNTELAQSIGLQTEAARDFYDLVIVGGGPGGLAAAVYAASEGLTTVLVEREAPGGQAGTSSRIENYLGFPSGLTGADLARRAVTQARRFGVEILTPSEAESLEIVEPYRIVRLTGGEELRCHGVMISTGVSYRRLPAPGAEALAGRGIYYGAAMTEAQSCEGEEVVVVGAGNSAGQAAVYFARYADRVHMLVRGDDLGKSMSHYLVERIEKEPRIEVHLRTSIAAAEGEDHLESLRCVRSGTASGENGTSGESTELTLATRSCFVFIGAAPRTDWLDGIVDRDARGFIVSGPDLGDGTGRPADWPLERDPYLLETSVPGVFVAGDVRHRSVKRVASAVGEGSIGVRFVHQHLAAVGPRAG